MVVKAKLKGGPFDGDEGSMKLKSGEALPEKLWAWSCGNPHCKWGVHWTRDGVEGHSLGAEIYRHDEAEGDVEIYVFVDVTGAIDEFLRTAVDDPVPA